MNVETGAAGFRLLEGIRVADPRGRGSPGREATARVRYQAGWARFSGGGPCARHLVRGPLLTFLDNTVVSVGLANVQSDLHAGVTSLQWVVNGYGLTFASFMRWPGCSVTSSGASASCSWGSPSSAPGRWSPRRSNADWLIAGRVIMGVGAAASEPGTLSIIRHVIPIERHGRMLLGIWAAVRAWPWPWAPSSGVSSSAFRAGEPSSGSTWGSCRRVRLAAVAVPETTD